MPSEEEAEQIHAGASITRRELLGQGLAVAGSVAIAPHLLRSGPQSRAQGSRAMAPRGQVIDAFTQEAVNFNPLLYLTFSQGSSAWNLSRRSVGAACYSACAHGSAPRWGTPWPQLPGRSPYTSAGY
jgi:hypothetical protein